MKNIVLFSLFLLFFSLAKAQKTVPAIKVGTEITYTANYNNTDYPYILTITQLKDSIKFAWKVESYGSGKYAIPQKSLETGNLFFQGVPKPGETMQLNDKETTGFISKAAFQELIKKKTTLYNGDTYTIITNPHPAYKLNGVELDIIYAISTKGKNEIWVLNNPEFPLVCKSSNSTSGIDLVLMGIK